MIRTRIPALFFALVLALSITACGESDDENGDENASENNGNNNTNENGGSTDPQISEEGYKSSCFDFSMTCSENTEEDAERICGENWDFRQDSPSGCAKTEAEYFDCFTEEECGEDPEQEVCVSEVMALNQDCQ